jgi:hypothetical protein
VAERQLPKLNVAGSIPVSRSKILFTCKRAVLIDHRPLAWINESLSTS